MQQHKPPAETSAAADAWYRQPVLWLGAVIFAASLAGCIWTIVLGARHADLPLDMTERPHTLLDMPMHAPARETQGTGQQAGAKAPSSRDATATPGQRP
ncbi:hypothetical protein J7I44_02740 [Frateuria sp. MAH-13]|uniref:Nitrogen fixation protein FixH n=1 Tax=Frateuria flava TaxID=2821489 RepID=A0ABS4DJI0_9GAMM|nr:hypothetical protein [Frateuria flava]MBP1473197.1 hypothetical protein [Frateuria flava]